MMKRNHTRLTGMFVIACAFLFLVDSALAQNPPYVKLINGKVVQGVNIRARSDGTVTLETDGQGDRTFTKDQYMEAVAAKPAEIDQAQKKVAAKDYVGAIPLLETVAKKYRFLAWDVKAMNLLPQVYVKMGDGAKAVEAYDKLFRANPESAKDQASLVGYFEALLAAEQYDKLDTKLDQMVAKGDRANAAKAQIIRGDAKMAQNQTEAAVLDYLRTAVLFKQEKEFQPEAYYKAAEALAKLKDPRAKDFYMKAAEFGSTPFGQKAAGKI